MSVFTPESYTYQFVPEVPVNNKTFLTFKVNASVVLYGCVSELELHYGCANVLKQL